MKGFEIPWAVEIPDNAVGVWEVPDLRTATPLFAGEWQAQAIVDAENSAWIGNYGRGRLITDHAGSKSGSGVWDMSAVTLDSTAFLVERNKTTQYQCKALWRANYRTTYYSFNGNGLYPLSSTDIMCLSCVDETGKEVYIGLYKKVGELP